MNAARQRIEEAGLRFSRGRDTEITLRDRREKARAAAIASVRREITAAKALARLEMIVAAYRTITVIPLPSPPDEPVWPMHPTAAQIIAEVAELRGVTRLELKSERRDKLIVQARHEAVWRMKLETSLSYPQIGRIFGRDHSTIMNAIRRHEGRLSGKPYRKSGQATKEPA